MTLLTFLLILLLTRVYAYKNDQEYRELVQFTYQLNNLTADWLKIDRRDHTSLPLALDLAILHHISDERWKQGGSWEAIAYTDLALQYLDALPDRERAKHRVLRYALCLHRARLLITTGMFSTAELNADKILKDLDVDVNKEQERALRTAALFTKGRALLSAGQVQRASSLFEQTYQHSPCAHQAYYQRALALSTTERREEMEGLAQVVRALLEGGRVQYEEERERVYLSPTHDTTARLCEFDRDEDFFFEIYRQGGFVQSGAALLSAQGEVKRQIITGALHWTLFLLYDKLGQPGIAWKHLMEARERETYRLYKGGRTLGQKAEGRGEGEEQGESEGESVTAISEAQTQQTLSFFRPGFWPLQRGDWVGSADPSLLFIVGFFRSGSTLLESLLSVHEGVLGMGEHSPFTFQMHELQGDLLAAVRGREGPPGEREGEREVGAEGESNVNYLQSLREPLSKHAEIVLEKMRDHFLQYERYEQITTLPFSPPVPPPSVPPHRAQRIVDKMLLNFRNIALIHLLFPRAVVLHTVRDPLDTLLSCLRNRFGDHSACSLRIPDVVLEYVLYLETMHHFHSVLPQLSYEVYSPPGERSRAVQRSAIIDVRYEELVANPAKVMLRLFSLLNLPAPSLQKMQRFYEQDRAVHTASFLQVKRPLYASSVGQWRRYAQQMKESVVKELEKYLPALRKKGALPYEKDARAPMNWNLSEHFDYLQHLKLLA